MLRLQQELKQLMPFPTSLGFIFLLRLKITFYYINLIITFNSSILVVINIII